MAHMKTRSHSVQENPTSKWKLAADDGEEACDPRLSKDESFFDLEAGQSNENTKQKVAQVCQSLYKIPVRAYIVIFYLMMEKLSFLGISALLPIYLNAGLGFTEKSSRTIYHCFSALCYLAPIVGALIADNGFGRFKTIFLFSMISLFGNLILPLTVLLSNNSYSFLVAIFIVATGSGGVKACLSAFAADQLSLKRKSGEYTNPTDDNTAVFFGVIYFAVNLGGFVGQILMPSLRTQTFGLMNNQTTYSIRPSPRYSYSLAFGVASLIYLASLPIFLMGHKVFVQRVPQGTPLTTCFQFMLYTVEQRIKHRTKTHTTDAATSTDTTTTTTLNNSKNIEQTRKMVTFTLDTPPTTPIRSPILQNLSSVKSQNRSSQTVPYSLLNSANTKYPPQFINELKQTFRVACLFLPIPVFWALYEQQGSTWIFQANKMDGYVWNFWSIKPEQMLTLNVLSCLMTIPIMNFIIYPWLSNRGLLDKMTSRIIVGYFMAASSFLCSAIVQLAIDQNLYGNLPRTNGSSNLVVHNQMDDLCSVRIQVEQLNNNSIRAIVNRNQTFRLDGTKSLHTKVQITPDSQCRSPASHGFDFKPDLYPGKETHIIVHQLMDSNNSRAKINYHQVSIDTEDIDPNYCFIQLAHLSGHLELAINLMPKVETKGKVISLGRKHFTKVPPGQYKIYAGKTEINPKHSKTRELELKAASIVLIQFQNQPIKKNESSVNVLWKQTILHQGKLVHITAQIPQIFLMTFAEILICISAISFAYSEAPSSMKTIMQSINQFTVFIGNILVIMCTIPSYHSMKQSWEMFAFTILSILCGGLMFVLVKRYEAYALSISETQHLPEPELSKPIINLFSIPPRTSFSYPNMSTVKQRTEWDVKHKRNYTSPGLTTALIQYRNALQRSHTTSLSLWSPQMTSGEPDMGGFIEWGEQIKTSYSMTFK